MLSLCLPFMGFACGKSPLMRVLIFFGKPFEASPENEPSPSKSHYGKTKYGDKIAPCGRKKNRLFKTVWKTVLFVTPYIRVKRGCAGDIAPIPTTAWRAVHRQSGTAFQAANGVCLLSEGILSFVKYAPRLRIVLPSRQKRMECASHFFSPSGDILFIFCLLDVFQ